MRGRDGLTLRDGFTLLEVLVALALVGILFVGIGGILERRITAQWRLESRLAAAQVGWNRMELFQLDGQPVEPAEEEGEARMAGQTFHWRRQVRKLGEKGRQEGHEGFEATIRVGPSEEETLHVERWRWRAP